MKNLVDEVGIFSDLNNTLRTDTDGTRLPKGNQLVSQVIHDCSQHHRIGERPVRCHAVITSTAEAGHTLQFLAPTKIHWDGLEYMEGVDE